MNVEKTLIPNKVRIGKPIHNMCLEKTLLHYIIENAFILLKMHLHYVPGNPLHIMCLEMLLHYVPENLSHYMTENAFTLCDRKCFHIM